MAVSITGGDRQVKSGTFDSVQNLTQSTATARQIISAHFPITTLSGGTATGISRDLYTVLATSTATDGISGPAVEGMVKTIFMLATGEAKVVFENVATGRVAGIPEMGTGTATQLGIYQAASATGAFTLSDVGHYIRAIYINKKWNIVSGVATYATAT